MGLPLLSKELIEQAARPRTYVVRAAYACLLFVSAYLIFYDTLSAMRSNVAAALGHGRTIFETMVMLQFAGIYLFMPAMTCGVLTLEKERNTLGLLFLTRLGPWTILFEKLLSRLVPMFGFLLLSLPLLAFAYSLGGVPEGYLWSAVWVLTLTAFQVGALALMCSAYFRTMIEAFIGTHVIGLALFFGLPFAQNLGLTRIATERWHAFLLFGPGVLFYKDPSIVTITEMQEFMYFAGRSVPLFLSSMCCLLLARGCIVRRAFLQPRNLLFRAFKWLDGLMLQLNQNQVTQGIVLIKESTGVPADEPAAWRETTKKSLGTTRYLIRVLLALEFPVAFLCVLVAAAASSGNESGLTSVLCIVWLFSVLLVSLKAASLISAERSHQTLDVLLATPLTGREIILQKYRGVRRLIQVVWVPFVTVFVFELCLKTSVSFDSNRAYGFKRYAFNPYLYSVCSVLSVSIYVPMVAWLSFHIGLQLRSQMRAKLGALAAVFGWCALPSVLIFLPLAFEDPAALPILLISPVVMVVYNETGALVDLAPSPWICVALNFLVYGWCLRLLRHLCLKHADRYLGRCGSPPSSKPIPAPPAGAPRGLLP